MRSYNPHVDLCTTCPAPRNNTTLPELRISTLSQLTLIRSPRDSGTLIEGGYEAALSKLVVVVDADDHETGVGIARCILQDVAGQDYVVPALDVFLYSTLDVYLLVLGVKAGPATRSGICQKCILHRAKGCLRVFVTIFPEVGRYKTVRVVCILPLRAFHDSVPRVERSDAIDGPGAGEVHGERGAVNRDVGEVRPAVRLDASLELASEAARLRRLPLGLREREHAARAPSGQRQDRPSEVNCLEREEEGRDDAGNGCPNAGVGVPKFARCADDRGIRGDGGEDDFLLRVGGDGKDGDIEKGGRRGMVGGYRTSGDDMKDGDGNAAEIGCDREGLRQRE